MRGNFLLYSNAFRLNNYHIFCDKIEALSSILQKAREENKDEVFQTSDWIGDIEITDTIKYFDLLNTEKDSEIESLIPNFSNDTRVLLTEFLGYYPTELECKNIDELEIEFPNQNNGLAGLEFKETDNLAKCVWNEDSWYNFHFQFFKNNPNNRHFIEQRQRLQGDKFNRYFPNLDYSNKVFQYQWELFYKQDKTKQEKEDYGKLFGFDDKTNLIKNVAHKIADCNFYYYNEELSNYNDKFNTNKKKTPYQIFQSGAGNQTIYLSTDFEFFGFFEVYNNRGQHQGEYRFDGQLNPNSQDKSGGHDIILPKK